MEKFDCIQCGKTSYFSTPVLICPPIRCLDCQEEIRLSVINMDYEKNIFPCKCSPQNEITKEEK